MNAPLAFLTLNTAPLDNRNKVDLLTAMVNSDLTESIGSEAYLPMRIGIVLSKLTEIYNGISKDAELYCVILKKNGQFGGWEF